METVKLRFVNGLKTKSEKRNKETWALNQDASWTICYAKIETILSRRAS